MGVTRLYSTLQAGYMFRSTISVFCSAGTILLGLEYFKDEAAFQRKWLLPLVHRLFDPETAHKLGVQIAKCNLFTGSSANCKDYAVLHCTLFGRKLSSPIGLAAGFDKNGEAIDGLRRCGFSFVEIGSVTPKRQPGNEPPRIFRLAEDQAVINSYGFNSDGAGPVLTRVKSAYDPDSPIPLGINLGKNKNTQDAAGDYEIGINLLGPFCDYLVINISSPNTPGLRSLQTREEIKKLLARIHDSLRIAQRRRDGRPALVIKISPDLSTDELKAIAEICVDRKNGIDGLIISNTTVSRPETLKDQKEAGRAGGLSGPPMRDMSTLMIHEMYRLTGGKITIIGCGGISTGNDAYEKIRAGACVVQLYTALVYQGFPVIGRIKRELAELLQRDGYKRVEDAIGADHRERR